MKNTARSQAVRLSTMSAMECMIALALTLSLVISAIADTATADQPATATEAPAVKAPVKGSPGELSWQIPGRVSIYDLQFGPATFKDNEWKFLGDNRTFNAAQYKGKLTLMVRFSYRGTRADIPLKFVIRLPDSRPYEETVNLTSRQGPYTYYFTIHDPENFVGSGSVYLYYGFSIIDVLDFTIVSGS
jgi:hypothetical protein